MSLTKKSTKKYHYQIRIQLSIALLRRQQVCLGMLIKMGATCHHGLVKQGSAVK